MLTLDKIKKSTGALKKIKRVGRGNASGHGTYSTRGLKGQGQRKGISNLKRLGMRKQLLKIPKSRGFKSLYPKNQVLDVEIINANFKDNEKVSPQTLLEKGLIYDIKTPVKILGKSTLKLKGLVFENIKMSASVKNQLK